MLKLKINDRYYTIVDNYEISKSSREVTFNSIKIDFTNKTTEDLPLKYQEVSIVDVSEKNGNIVENKKIFTGYVNMVVLPKMKNEEEFRELEIELLSPMSLATRRTITIVGEYELNELIMKILEPLFNDGFELVEFNVGNSSVTVNYLIETVESSLNKLSNKYNFWWYIDENKGIYINSIDYTFAQKPKLIYNDDKKLKGLINIIPSIDATEYCNVVNFTNVRVWKYSYQGTFSHQKTGFPTEYYDLSKDSFIDTSQTIKNDNEISFIHPIDITIKNAIKSRDQNLMSNIIEDYKNYILLMEFTYSDNTTDTVYIRLNSSGDGLEISNNATLDENEENKAFTFKRDSFFNNLIVGFKYKNSKNIKSIETVFSCSCLMWTRLKFNNMSEINKSKNKVSKSGQIEKNIDMNEQWKTIDELKQIATSNINISSNQSDEVELLLDENYNLKIGDIVRINKPCFLINNDYIITDIYESKVNSLYYNYRVILRNNNYLESFIDLFRYKETETLTEKTYSLTTIDYSTDSIKEVHEVV